MGFIETLQITEQKPFTGFASSVMRREKKRWNEGESVENDRPKRALKG